MAMPKYRKDVALDIFEKMASGRSLRSVLAEPGMPGPTTVRRWVEQNAELRTIYVQSRQKAIAQKFG